MYVHDPGIIRKLFQGATHMVHAHGRTHQKHLIGACGRDSCPAQKRSTIARALTMYWKPVPISIWGSLYRHLTHAVFCVCFWGRCVQLKINEAGASVRFDGGSRQFCKSQDHRNLKPRPLVTPTCFSGHGLLC